LSSYSLEPANMTFYGLTTSSAAANSALRKKGDLDYDILSDPRRKLISAMGYKDARGRVKRGAFIIAKDGTLLLRRTGGSIINIAEEVYRILKAIAKINTERTVGGCVVPF
jgi:peroxiredoxin